jgi:hypothetical protein
MSERTINNKERGKQMVSYKGLFDCSMSASDIDGIVDYKNKAWLLYEIKCSGLTPYSCSHGQITMLERLTDNLGKVKPSVLFWCSHDFPTDEDVSLADCEVWFIRFNEEWIHIPSGIRAKDITKGFIHMVDRGDFDRVTIVE